VTGVLAVVKDVTSLRRLHEQMVRSSGCCGGSARRRSRHEVGNPLTCISALAQVLIRRTSDKAILDGLENIEVHVVGSAGSCRISPLDRPAPATLREQASESRGHRVISRGTIPAVRRMKMDSVAARGGSSAVNPARSG